MPDKVKLEKELPLVDGKEFTAKAYVIPDAMSRGIELNLVHTTEQFHDSPAPHLKLAGEELFDYRKQCHEGQAKDVWNSVVSKPYNSDANQTTTIFKSAHK